MKKAIITGASSGIGRALSIEMAGDYELFLCGRNNIELEKTRQMISLPDQKRVHLISLDLNEEKSVKEAAEKILKLTDSIDVLINNAGQSQRSVASQTSVETERKLFEVNYFGPVALTKHLLTALRKAKSAKIVIVSSIVGKFGFPLRSTYSAAKHALHGFFESLQFEEEKNDISVQFMIIGRVKTNISSNAITGDGKRYGILDEGQKFGLSAEDCARKIKSTLNGNKKETLIGGKEVWMVYFKKFFPYLFYYFGAKESNHV